MNVSSEAIRATMQRHVAAVAMTVLGVAALVGFGSGHAQNFPAKPLRILVPHPPGGPTDIVARLFADKLSAQLGQAVIVESRAGGNGLVLMSAVAGMPADGYVMALATNTPLAVQPVVNQYVKSGDMTDYNKLMRPLAFLGDSPMALALNPNRGIRTIPQLVAIAKANPGKLNSGNGAGIGGGDHLGTELFNHAVGIQSSAVPYKGIAAVALALASGEIDYAFTTVGAFIPLRNAGKLEIIAVASDRRLDYLPDVPTVNEAVGLKDFRAASWLGVWVRSNVDSKIVSALNAEFQKAGKMPDLRGKALSAAGFEIRVSTPEELQKLVDEDLKKLGDLLKLGTVKLS